MVYFTEIKKTKHYIEEHEQNFPWSEVIQVIFKSSKNIRKKDEKYEIETDKYYILMVSKIKDFWNPEKQVFRWN